MEGVASDFFAGDLSRVLSVLRGLDYVQTALVCLGILGLALKGGKIGLTAGSYALSAGVSAGSAVARWLTPEPSDLERELIAAIRSPKTWVTKLSVQDNWPAERVLVGERLFVSLEDSHVYTLSDKVQARGLSNKDILTDITNDLTSRERKRVLFAAKVQAASLEEIDRQVSRELATEYLKEKGDVV